MPARSILLLSSLAVPRWLLASCSLDDAARECLGDAYDEDAESGGCAHNTRKREGALWALSGDDSSHSNVSSLWVVVVFGFQLEKGSLLR